MPLDVKIFDLKVLGSEKIQIEDFNILGPSKSKLLASSRPERWPLDVKIFDLEVLGSQNIQNEDSSIQPTRQMAPGC